MTEISASPLVPTRGLVATCENALRAGYKVDEVLAAHGLTVEALQRSLQDIPWNACAQLTDEIATCIGGFEAYRRFRRTYLPSRIDPAVVSLMAMCPTPIQSMALAQIWYLDGAYPVQTDLTIDGTASAVLDVWFDEALRGSEGFMHGVWATIEVTSLAIGMPMANVTAVELSPHTARFEIRTSARHRLKERLRRRGLRRAEVYEAVRALAERQARIAAAYQDLALEHSRREQAEADLAAALEDIHRGQRMESLGLLSAMVAHDFNNMLTIVLGHSDALLEHSDTAVRARAQAMTTAANHSAQLTGQLLAFGKQRDASSELIDLSDMVRSRRELLESVARPGRLEFSLHDGALPVWVDQGLLSQAIVNLIANARDASKQGDTITVASSLIESRPGARTWVRLSVTDQGPGIDPEHLDRIFEPYFTTKLDGAGLGLASVYGAIGQMGGRVGVENRAPTGADFTIDLPLAEVDMGAES